MKRTEVVLTLSVIGSIALLAICELKNPYIRDNPYTQHLKPFPEVHLDGVAAELETLRSIFNGLSYALVIATVVACIACANKMRLLLLPYLIISGILIGLGAYLIVGYLLQLPTVWRVATILGLGIQMFFTVHLTHVYMYNFEREISMDL